MAKIWINWNQSPFDAVKGASTTYASFMKNIVDRSFVPDENYYKETIALLINNMLELYPNPTTTDIPDFDSDDFMDTDGETSLY